MTLEEVLAALDAPETRAGLCEQVYEAYYVRLHAAAVASALGWPKALLVAALAKSAPLRAARNRALRERRAEPRRPSAPPPQESKAPPVKRRARTGGGHGVALDPCLTVDVVWCAPKDDDDPR